MVAQDKTGWLRVELLSYHITITAFSCGSYPTVTRGVSIQHPLLWPFASTNFAPPANDACGNKTIATTT